MNNIREIQKINEQELERGLAGTSASWHQKYLQSAWVHVGNLDHSLTEGDVICVMSQFGEIDDINMARDEATGKSKGFCFLKYEDARSCVLAIDNLVGADVCGRSLRVDHVEKYRLPKHLQSKEDAAPVSTAPGHAYHEMDLKNEFSLQRGQDLFKAEVKADGSLDGGEEVAKRLRKEERRRRHVDKLDGKSNRKQRKNDRKESRRIGADGECRHGPSPFRKKHRSRSSSHAS
ncbi:hypothetical protein MPSEU_000518800 [Mayamaea pseudoterrestris]|nr:hypothetical protein MPSEU_000518800 [Mayamaea pseudoterrestris]